MELLHAMRKIFAVLFVSFSVEQGWRIVEWIPSDLPFRISPGERKNNWKIRCRVECPRLMCPWPKILGCWAPWTKRPFDILLLTDVSRPWTTSSMELAPSAAIANFRSGTHRSGTDKHYTKNPMDWALESQSYRCVTLWQLWNTAYSEKTDVFCVS